MNKKIMIILGSILAVLILTFVLFRFFSKDADERTQAYESYLKGESAQTIAERQKAFNDSLKHYLSLEEKYHPTMGNGKLYYDIANTYFELEQYPLSILYYYKSLRLRPRDSHVQDNLNLAKEKLELKKSPQKSIIDNTYLSIPEKLQLFFAFSLITFVLYSIAVWIPKSSIQKSGHFFLALSILFFLSLMYAHFIVPLEGVLMQPSKLLKGPALYYSKVLEKPVFSGTKVRVLEVSEQGTWLKVETPDGKIGYVSNETVRMI